MAQSSDLYDDVPGGSYVRGTYNVPAYKGGRVTVDGKPGTIVSCGSRLLVLFDGDAEPIPAHPTWRVEYLTGGE